ncbi:MAG: T9SS type A sorting domain-containing protein [bacterium]|nr:T9SS type A sorting domain-containing protein [bacterium]
MKVKSIFLAFSLISLTALSQRANVWYFGNNAGLNFNTNPPTALSNGMIVNPDNASTISNSAGSVLFYTDGSTVWNKNHAVMPNGSGLIGNFTAGQCALIIPVPCDTNRYVIFHLTEFANPGYLHYSVVDMNLNVGLGDVVSTQKNISLGSGWTEKLCSYYNSTNNSYWVLAHKWNSDQFVALNVSASSIATQSVISAVGGIHNCGTYSAAHDAMGQLTISPDGTKVLNAFTCQDKYELFNFNANTGVVSNPIVLPSQGGYAWGTAFSPDSKKIFTNSIYGQMILQYDVNTYIQSAIVASQTTLVAVSTSGYNFGYMELGPDNKLYIARPGTSFLAVVNNPNVLGAGSNFSLSGQSLGSKTSTHGLSRIAYSIPNTFTPGLSLTISASPTAVCLGQASTLIATGATMYQWSNNTTSSTTAVSPTSASIYTVTGTSSNSCGLVGGSATVQVLVNPLPIITISGTKSICPGQSTILTASGGQSYIWSTGATTSSLIVTGVSTMTFSVSGTSPNNCTNTSTALVGMFPVPTISISGKSVVCYGQSTTLTANGAVNYQWSNGFATPSIVVTPTGLSSFSVVGSTGTSPCSSNASITVNVTECLGAEQNLKQNAEIKVFPNPFIDKIIVDGGRASNRNAIVSVANSLGEIVFSIQRQVENESSERQTLDLKDFPPGVYFLTICNGSEQKTCMIVKN